MKFDYLGVKLLASLSSASDGGAATVVVVVQGLPVQLQQLGTKIRVRE